MCVNGFTVTDADQAAVGTAVYLAASALDHSCLPNAAPVFDGATVNVRAIRDIAPYSIDEVCAILHRLCACNTHI